MIWFLLTISTWIMAVVLGSVGIIIGLSADWPVNMFIIAFFVAITIFLCCLPFLARNQHQLIPSAALLPAFAGPLVAA